MVSAWSLLNRNPDNEPLRVGADRCAHPQLHKYKNSPAVLIPTGLVLRIATLKRSNRRSGLSTIAQSAIEYSK